MYMLLRLVDSVGDDGVEVVAAPRADGSGADRDVEMGPSDLSA